MTVVAGEHVLVFSVIVHGKLLVAKELLVTIFTLLRLITFDRWQCGGRGGEDPAISNLVFHTVMSFQHSMGSGCVVTLGASEGFLFLCVLCVCGEIA